MARHGRTMYGPVLEVGDYLRHRLESDVCLLVRLILQGRAVAAIPADFLHYGRFYETAPRSP